MPGLGEGGRGHGALSDEEAALMFGLVDLDVDGRVNLAELSRALFHVPAPAKPTLPRRSPALTTRGCGQSPDVAQRLLATRFPSLVDFVRKAPALPPPCLRAGPRAVRARGSPGR